SQPKATGERVPCIDAECSPVPSALKQNLYCRRFALRSTTQILLTGADRAAQRSAAKGKKSPVDASARSRPTWSKPSIVRCFFPGNGCARRSRRRGRITAHRILGCCTGGKQRCDHQKHNRAQCKAFLHRMKLLPQLFDARRGVR